MQIYNEEIFDLLGEQEEKLVIKKDKIAGTYVKGITEFKIGTQKEGLWLLKKGEKLRAIRETKLNTNSSRSHLILNIRYESKSAENGFMVVRKNHFFSYFLERKIEIMRPCRV